MEGLVAWLVTDKSEQMEDCITIAVSRKQVKELIWEAAQFLFIDIDVDNLMIRRIDGYDELILTEGIGSMSKAYADEMLSSRRI